MDRYVGKPFLRLLECYVLHAIHQLDPGQEAALRGMEPKLKDIYGAGGGWVDIVAKQMQFPDSLPAQIMSIWQAGLARAERQGQSVNAEDFAVAFVDENFSVS